MRPELKKLKLVKGNRINIAIPMQKVTFTSEGKITEDFIPVDGSILNVELESNSKKFNYTPTIDNNILHVIDDGGLPVGSYSVTVTVDEPDGTKRRSKWCNVIAVYDDNAPVLNEFDDFPEYAEGLIVDGNIFFFAKGEPGTTDYNELVNTPLNVSAFNNDVDYYIKPNTGIPSTDMSQEVQASLGKADTALLSFTETDPTVPSWAKAQNPPAEVFWATYGTTTAAEIDAAVAAGKMVYSIYSNQYCPLMHITNDFYSFVQVNRNIATLRLDLNRSTSVWSVGSFPLELASRKVTSWQSTPNNTHYPSEKLVKDSLDSKADISSMSKWGVISQEITWTANEYSLSNQVYGMIPIANIDLFKMGGAEFNDSDTDLSITDMYGRTYTHKAGCFKLNGLGDISYQEMLTIYTEARMSQPFMTANGEPAPRYLEKTKARTNMWNLPANWNTGASLYGLGMYNADGNLTTIGLGFRDDANAFYPRACRQMLNACPRVKYVYPVLNCQNITGTGSAGNTFYSAFSTAYKLQEIRLKALKISVPFGSCSELSVASILYMIQNEASTSAITITLHPTAYARAIADSDVQAALQAHTNVSLASA